MSNNQLVGPLSSSRTSGRGAAAAGRARGRGRVLLEGGTVIVTGGASPRGIGGATVRLPAEQGAAMAILDLDRSARVMSEPIARTVPLGREGRA